MAIESFQSAPPAIGGAIRSASRRSHAVYIALQREIMLGELSPKQVVLELDLASRFACSQGTVREALLQLQEEGLVNRIPHRGTAVADCNADDARELLHIRHDIETRGVLRTMARDPQAVVPALQVELEAMRKAADAGDEFALSAHDRLFHLILFAAADLPAVQPILSRCLLHNHRFKILNSAPNRALRETADRHVAIIDAIVAGDAKAVGKTLSHHIATIVDFGPSIIGGTAPGADA
ncbi:GntR family transcriptional regulator [Acuticoccus sp. M5D2P5]|uniref:GntR family transcriptional regulator n=1 Tax=Acuticoccus kalidii TaxID=2910977 RepID=UPI001F38D4CC|nr:GntR family transcriptional regulator [Acuticoccus kalidii]MCF3935680.1 GntR family transcriptional regulator [Acuticoccus kalidii]